MNLFKILKSKFVLTILSVIGILLIVIYSTLYTQESTFKEESKSLYISSDHIPTPKELIYYLDTAKIISNIKTFKFYADFYKMWRSLKPGRYEIKKNSSIKDIIEKITIGKQDPVSFTLKKIRTIEDLASLCGKVFEGDSLEFMSYFLSSNIQNIIEETSATFLSLFIPNTYYLYWNTSPEKFIIRLKEEHNKFWNLTRVQKAALIKLDEREVYTLASIIEEETLKDDEKSTIASVYLNRLRLNIKLEADPTVKYCTRNFGLKRITFKHISDNADCAYNTYSNYGLPPGPICTPSIKTIDAVLNSKPTDYLFFCARPERDGYHAFATNYKDHMINAYKFHKVLNTNKIK